MEKLFTLMLCCTTTVLIAQEDKKEKKLSISGTVDVYYQTNLSSTDKAFLTDDDGESIPQTFGTSFANETGFALGMANIIASYETGKVGAVVDIVFGPRGNDAITGNNINQLYAYWNVSEKTTLTIGRFNTYLGYEVISPTGNFNYSTSYLFSSGPFSHVGLKADFSLSEDFSLMLAFMNPTDTDSNTNGGYALGAQLGYKGQFLNFYYDDKEVLGFEIDYTGGFDISEEFYLGLNSAYADNDGEGFFGAAIYPQYSISDAFGLGLRAEYFDWQSDADTTIDDLDVFGLTLTGNYSIKNLTIIPELRLDSNSEEVYFDNDLEPTKSFSTFLLAAVYKF